MTKIDFLIQPIPKGELSTFFARLWDTPTHLIYFLLSILAIWNISSQIVYRMVQSSAISNNLYYAKLFLSVLLVSTTFIHLIYIYKSLIETEELVHNHKSFFQIWIGKRREYLIRMAGMVFLIGAFNKYSLTSLLPQFKPEHVVSVCTFLLFFVFILWDAFATYYQVILGVTLDNKEGLWGKWEENTDWVEIEEWWQYSPEVSDKEEQEKWLNWIKDKHKEDNETWKRALLSYGSCDFFALLHWLCISVYLFTIESTCPKCPVISDSAFFFSILFIIFYSIATFIRIGWRDKLALMVYAGVYFSALAYHIMPNESKYMVNVAIGLFCIYFTVFRPLWVRTYNKSPNTNN